jgi:hypothetical protein
MMEFDARVCGIPCIVRVTYWEAYLPANVSGPPESCYPAEGGEGDWEILDTRGRPAPWLEKKMTDRDRNLLSEEVFNHMEQMETDYDY